MDAHDIFKKLTKGAYFSRKNNNKRKYEKKIVVDIKQEERPEDVKIKEEEIEDEGNISENLEVAVDDTEFVYVNKDENEAEPPKKKKKKSDNVETKRKLLEQEELNHFRNIHRISVSGKQVPAPIKTFDELETDYNVPSKLIENLAVCGYPIPTPIQMQAIPIMLQGKSLMACAPTGSGKTVAFLTPILRDLKGPQKKGFRAIILCPTRELAQQTYRECLRLTEKIGLKTHMISKASQAEQKFGEKSNKKYDILVSTPNRVCYLLNHDPPILDFKNVEWFVVDEADKLMEEGMNSFKEQFDQILNACSNPNRKVALFSATYTVPVAKWALRNLKGLIRCTVGERNAATETVQQELLFVGCESGKLLAFRDLVRGGLQPPVLVFVQSKDRAKQLFGELIYDGINVDVIHAERTQQQRDNVVRAFREGKIWVLICTELMGRGIDFKGVNLVVNYDFPPTSISYIHRIGRTGRAGRPGRAITYFTQDDTVNLRSIAHIIRNSGGQVPEFMLKLKKTKRSERKQLAKRAPERENITTVPKFELERREQLKKADEVLKRKEEKKNFVGGKKTKTNIADDLKTLTKKKRGFMKTKKIKA